MQFSLIQLVYVTLAITGIVLNTRQRTLAWPVALLSTGLSLYVYYAAGFYAKCLLNCIYITLEIYGWYYWLYGGRNKTRPPVSKISFNQLAVLPVFWLAGAWGLGTLFARYTDASMPYWDSLHTAMAITGQWLTDRKKLESWGVWVLTNIVYAAVLYYKGRYLLSGVHLFYNVLAINGYRAWRQSYLAKELV